MIPRGLRLSRSGFPALSRGKRRESPHFSLSIAPTEKGGCAVVVPKKVAIHAVDRHRVKRRVLAVLAPWCATDIALAVYAKKGAAALSYARLEEEVRALVESFLPPARRTRAHP